MCRSLHAYSFLLAMLTVAPAFAQQGQQAGQPVLQAGQTGLQGGQPGLQTGQTGLQPAQSGVQTGQTQQPGPQTPPPSSRIPRQGSSFDRVATVRHQVTVGPARAGKGAAAQAPATSLGQTQSARRPLSVQSRSSAHTFYPGMRSSQSPNMNIPQYRSRSSRFMYPGMFMNSGMGRPGAARSPGKTGR